MSEEQSEMSPVDCAKRVLTLDLDAFALKALEDEARGMGVPVEELASFALMYYLADYDSGRVARQMPQRVADIEKNEPAAPSERQTLTKARAR
jgi:hypothetical protein